MSLPIHMPALLQLTQRVVIAAEGSLIELEPFRVQAGEWLLLRPAQEALGPDPMLAIARVLAALELPREGSVELFGASVTGLGQEGMARVRRQLALVQSSGGLLSNRTLRQNVALPISVHRQLAHEDERAHVTAILERFELLAAAELYPHQASAGTRLRTCHARAASLSPALYIVEGAGEFVSESHAGLSWARLVEAKLSHGASVVACVTRIDQGFERWFSSVGGSVCTYRVQLDPARPEGWLSR